jgi:two-component SAPR family response regulator
LAVATRSASGFSSWKIYLGIGGVLLLLVVGLTIRKKRPGAKASVKKSGDETKPESATVIDTVTAISLEKASNLSQPAWSSTKAVPGIMVFGSFEVIDRDGNNITRLFTPLLQELFLLITFFTIKTGHGISSEKLNEILWKDKSEKDAKNNRSVNIAKLKAILEKLDDCSISKESGKWMLIYNPGSIYIDLLEFLRLAEDKQSFDKSMIERLLAIISRGSFLQQVEYSWLDDIKSDISNKALNMLIAAGNSLEPAGHAEQMIEIANCIFLFDQVNENALVLKCRSLTYLGRHSLAKNVYEKFAKDYRHMYGEEFRQSYAAIISG